MPIRTATPARSISTDRDYGLPGVISSQNNYYLWGTRGYDGRSLIAIGATRIDLLRRYYRSVVIVRTSTEPYKWIVEGPSPIYLCRDPVAPLDGDLAAPPLVRGVRQEGGYLARLTVTPTGS